MYRNGEEFKETFQKLKSAKILAASHFPNQNVQHNIKITLKICKVQYKHQSEEGKTIQEQQSTTFPTYYVEKSFYMPPLIRKMHNHPKMCVVFLTIFSRHHKKCIESCYFHNEEV